MEAVLTSHDSVGENPTIGREISTVLTLAGVRETPGMINDNTKINDLVVASKVAQVVGSWSRQFIDICCHILLFLG